MSFPDEAPPRHPSIERPPIDLSFLDTVPVRLPQITSEELEHADDEWLDGAYERKLIWSGEEPGPVKNAAQLANVLIAGSLPVSDHLQGNVTNGRTSAAAVKAVEKLDLVPVFDELPGEPIVLTEDSTQEEMLAYAREQPVVRQALRIFRGKIVEVKRRAR
jgi:hypothetical protein